MPEPIIVLADDAREIPPPKSQKQLQAGGTQPDEMVFSDGRRRVFIPRFRMATRLDEHRIQRHRLTLERGPEYVLGIHLEPYAAPLIAAEARNASQAGDLAGDTDVSLRLFSRNRESNQLDLILNERVQHEGLLRATVRIHTKEEQTLFNALIDDRDTEITCRVERNRFSDALKALKASLEGMRKNLIIRLGRIPVAIVYDPKTTPQRMALEKEIREVESQIATIGHYAGKPLPSLELSVDRNDVPPAPAPSLGLIQRTVGAHHYYQSTSRTNRFYYLPDHYDFNTRPNGLPEFLKIRRGAVDGEFQIDYEALPRVDKTGRLMKHARNELAAFAGNPQAAVELYPLLPEQGSVTFRIKVFSPQSANRWSELQRTDAVQTLHRRVKDSIAVTGEGLQWMYDALFADSAVLFTGTVGVRMGDWQDSISFNGRIEGDREAAWKTFYDDKVPPQYERTIRVEGQGLERVTSVTVRFKNGGDVTLTKSNPNAVGKYRMNITDFILRRPDEGDYEYQTIVRPAAGPETTRPWITASDPVLTITA